MSRQEQKEERKKNILINALNLFVTRGYAETKISDIAESVQMSTGLMFHYFSSKEQLYLELVKMGLQGTHSVQHLDDLPPEMYFTEFLRRLFAYSVEQPWVFQMFVLMGQARKIGTPEEVRKIALSVNQIEESAKVIRKGQETGVFREGDPMKLSAAFWSSVQGIMEQMAAEPDLSAPEPEWIVSILMK